MDLIDKIELIDKVFKDNELHSQTYKNACLEVLNKALEPAINYTHCCTELKDFCTYTLNENESVINDLIKDFKNRDL